MRNVLRQHYWLYSFNSSVGREENWKSYLVLCLKEYCRLSGVLSFPYLLLGGGATTISHTYPKLAVTIDGLVDQLDLIRISFCHGCLGLSLAALLCAYHLPTIMRYWNWSCRKFRSDRLVEYFTRINLMWRSLIIINCLVLSLLKYIK